MPIPKPTSGEEKDSFINRCKNNDVMLGEYPDASQRTAVCNSSWDKHQKMGREFIQFAKGTNELDVEIFAVGEWNGLDFTLDDLKLIAMSFDSLQEVHKVPLKFGHNEEQPFTDGQPALGWIEKVWVAGEKLMAHFTEIPDIVFEAMETKRYRHVSIELDMGVEHKDIYYPWVLSGVALLGADIPAVNTLADLTTYMGREDAFSPVYMGEGLSFKQRVSFTMDTKVKPQKMEDINMSELAELQEKFKTLEAKLTAVQTEHDKSIIDNTALNTENVKLKADFKAKEAVDEHRKLKEQREALHVRLEKLVEERKIIPATREEFMRDYDDAAGTKDGVKHILFAVEKMEKTIENNPQYFGAEQARLRKEKEEAEQGKNASTVVMQRTNELMNANNKLDFVAAQNQVLRADPELAERYVKGED